MNDEPHEIWFYTHDGERRGPVSFSDLTDKEKDGSLNPRHDMVWTKGMNEWKPAGEIDGLFKRRAAPEPEESLAPPADPYAPPQQESVAEQMGKEGNWPGARRRSYILVPLAATFIWFFGFVRIVHFLGSQFGPELTRAALPALALVLPLITIYFAVRRLENLGMSRWWFLGNFVPFLNVWIGYRCFACPAGYAFHKKLDGPGILLAIIYWLMIAIGVLSIAAVIALLMGAIGSPELQEQLKEALRNATEAQP